MCLYRKWTSTEVSDWQKRQPDIIIAYKVVKTNGNKIYPIYFYNHDKPFQKNNILEEKEEEISTSNKDSVYLPYYHVFAHRKDALNWASVDNEIVLECEIPKNQITAIGTQGKKGEMRVIVTKEFTFVDGSEFFGGN